MILRVFILRGLAKTSHGRLKTPSDSEIEMKMGFDDD